MRYLLGFIFVIGGLIWLALLWPWLWVFYLIVFGAVLLAD